MPFTICAARGGAHSDALRRRRGRKRRQHELLHVLQQRAALVLHQRRQGAGQLLRSCEQQPAVACHCRVTSEPGGQRWRVAQSEGM